ncbi:hypothetical protein HK103_001888 [Boothiomyces macroporosus]|uniref:Cytochrome P450 n=1 Tax=Boothiomyces macroporosus TaxID=261099 RepID=A0AAD5UAS6_9FUNG|nr:hypothetical protein HK103_001888 [Boothiomyces macroporosus]
MISRLLISSGVLLATAAIICIVSVNRKVALVKKLNPDARLDIRKVYLPFQLIFERAEIRLPSFLTTPFDFMYNNKMDRYRGEDRITFIVAPDLIAAVIADAKFIEEAYEKKNEFVKPIKYYNVLQIYGENILTLDGKAWKRHRKFVSPQFSERTNILVHQEAVRSCQQMIDHWEASGEIDGLINITVAMFYYALGVVSAASFGTRLNWVDDPNDKPEGFNLTLKQSLTYVTHHLFQYILTPNIAYYLPFEGLQTMKRNFEENKEKSNLLSSMVRACEGDSETFTDEELIGNIFIFLFAGHETSAGTLNYILTLLALHPHVQERLYQEVKLTCGDQPPEYKHINQVPYCFAIINESLRLYPAVVAVPKLAVTNATIGKYVIPENTDLFIHTHGVQHHEKYWGKDYEEFKPERWFEDQECAQSAEKVYEKIQADTPIRAFYKFEKYAFTPFSDGPRACIGRRFSEVEMLVALIMLSQRYKITIPPGPDPLVSCAKITYKTTKDVLLKFTIRQ